MKSDTQRLYVPLEPEDPSLELPQPTASKPGSSFSLTPDVRTPEQIEADELQWLKNAEANRARAAKEKRIADAKESKQRVAALVEKMKLEHPEIIKALENEKKASAWRKEYWWNYVAILLAAVYCFYLHQARDGFSLLLFMMLYRAVATIGDRGH